MTLERVGCPVCQVSARDVEDMLLRLAWRPGVNGSEIAAKTWMSKELGGQELPSELVLALKLRSSPATRDGWAHLELGGVGYSFKHFPAIIGDKTSFEHFVIYRRQSQSKDSADAESPMAGVVDP